MDKVERRVARSLVEKGLAEKGHMDERGHPVGYFLTTAGRNALEELSNG